ncbi:MAG TPA: GAF domain-containing protein [Thermoleophilaceae bacterium]
MKRWLTSLPARILEGLLGAALFTYGVQQGVLGEKVALWIALLAMTLGGACTFVATSVLVTRRSLYPYYAEHVREALNTLQRVAAGHVTGVTTAEFVERGILAPACYWLTQAGGESVRMTVIRPQEPDRREFELLWESGHSVEARHGFSLEIAGSFAGVAFTRGETQWTNDVEKDPRWMKHPKARPGREYGSLVSVPIRMGEDVVAVFNAISRRNKAFSPADLNYLELLGALISMIYSGAHAGASVPPAGP